eukprot:m.463660 g.463660  ORF g.463660 m.463660 type:complete len:499 (-) comp20354_c0_seq10:37-1533(-)
MSSSNMLKKIQVNKHDLKSHAQTSADERCRPDRIEMLDSSCLPAVFAALVVVVITGTASGTSVTTSAGQCTILPALRVDGNDIRGVDNVTSPGGCCDLCTATLGCEFFTYVHDKSLCWLKFDSDGVNRTDTDCTSGRAPSGSGKCVDAGSCNHAGKCVDGKCVCAVGFKGLTCSELNIGDPYDCGEGGMCLTDKSTWGGGAVQDDDGSWHMFGALMNNNCRLASWLTNSVVVHSVSKTGPQGPYNFSDLALTPRDRKYFDGVTVHNPDIRRAPDGTWLLYYMGSTDNSTVSKNCSTLGSSQSVLEFNQRIGLATSKSLYGPWTRLDKPVIDVSARPFWDDGFTTNPAPFIYPNGTVLVIYKARSWEDPNNMREGVAVADHYLGPYRKLSQTYMDVSGSCEDAGLWRDPDDGTFRMLLHCGCAGQYMWSTDAINWNRTTPVQRWCDLTLHDGRNVTLSRRERPKLLIDAKTGQPVYLSTGTLSKDMHGDRTFTMVARLL